MISVETFKYIWVSICSCRYNHGVERKRWRKKHVNDFKGLKGIYKSYLQILDTFSILLYCLLFFLIVRYIFLLQSSSYLCIPTLSTSLLSFQCTFHIYMLHYIFSNINPSIFKCFGYISKNQHLSKHWFYCI